MKKFSESSFLDI